MLGLTSLALINFMTTLLAIVMQDNALPAMLWLGRGIGGVPCACLVTGAWVVALAAAARIVYRALSVRYEEVGG